MNDIQLYELYRSMPIGRASKLYNRRYVVITGIACIPPHPHRYYSLEEFLEVLENDPKFKEFLLST